MESASEPGPAAKKTAAKKTAAKKAPAKKAPAKKAPQAKKAAAKKRGARQEDCWQSAIHASERWQDQVRPGQSGPLGPGGINGSYVQVLQEGTQRAKKLVDDPKALRKVAEEASRTANTRTGAFHAVIDDFRTLTVLWSRTRVGTTARFRLTSCDRGGRFDLCRFADRPDSRRLPGGLVDDAVVIGWVSRPCGPSWTRSASGRKGPGPSSA